MKTSSPVAADDDDDPCFSPVSCLPNEVSLAIFKKLDLKTLFVCKLVSKHFYATVHKVDAIYYTTRFPSIQCDSYSSAELSVEKFDRVVKSLCIRYPSSSQVSIIVNNNDGNLFKWKVKMGFKKIDSFVIISPTSIYDKKAGNVELPLQNIEWICLQDVILRAFMLWLITTINIPLLEKVSITDKWGFYVNGSKKIDKLRNLIRAKCPNRKMECYVPMLELPISGYVMKGVTLVLMDWDDVTYDSYINDEIDFKQDKKEAAYHEAVMEILKKHRGSRRINH